MSAFSLPTQRCFQTVANLSDPMKLFSAYAEVFLSHSTSTSIGDAFLCLRRGVSSATAAASSASAFSLPTQRCFFLLQLDQGRQKLFSAYAEVFPPLAPLRPDGRPFLCLRRGVSSRKSRRRKVSFFSLPTQRCFRRRRPARVLSRAFLCLRRGVSRRVIKWVPAYPLFSAYAEVFPALDAAYRSGSTFLCLRRGVSILSYTEIWYSQLFSAYAEVFLG